MDLQVTAARLSGDTDKDVKTLANYIFQLEEQLRYMLRNLDVTNFNDLGLARYENGRMQIYSEKLEIATNGISARIGELEGEYTTLEASVSGLTTTVQGHTTSIGTMSSTITQNSNKINAVVQNVGRNGSVTAASIVAAINSAGSSVKISADHVVLSGLVTVESLQAGGSTVIDGSRIQTGYISADRISGGTLEGVMIKSQAINGAYGTVIISGAAMSMGDALLWSEDGKMLVDNTGVIEITSRSEIRIRPSGSGNYWEFTNSGIYWKSPYGEILNRVTLAGD